MNYESVKKTLRIFTVIFSLAAVINVFIGFDKMLRYNSGEKYGEDPHNAYVGGDAYNFIINGTYSTAYFVLAAGFVISSTLCFAGGYLVEAIEVGNREKREDSDRIIAELKRLSSTNISQNRSDDMKLPEL